MAEEDVEAIAAVSVKGFKSFAEEQRIEIRPLTILAGANSSGKSSALQPLLLLKQTLEVSYDPGPLLLDGPHVQFTSADQLLARTPGKKGAGHFELAIERVGVTRLTLSEGFSKKQEGDLDITFMALSNAKLDRILRPGMSSVEISKVVGINPLNSRWEVDRNRCFLKVKHHSLDGRSAVQVQLTDSFDRLLRAIVHVPGLRGNPSRTYKRAAVGKYFPGTFEHYVASLILAWQQSGDDRLGSLDRALEVLGLTWKVHANLIDATRVELLVGRLPSKKRGIPSDLVSIADVGFGVSQTLPVLVALLAAQPGQLVYLEQPELHLHPRAQQALATVLAEAALRGVRVVAETHSSLLLLAIQALVAEGKLPPDQVILHWFQRDSRGATQVKTADLDRMGAYGDWPEDFYRVSASLENRYLTAVEAVAFGGKKSAKGKG